MQNYNANPNPLSKTPVNLNNMQNPEICFFVFSTASSVDRDPAPRRAESLLS